MRKASSDMREFASYRENQLAYIENTLSFENQQLKGAIIHKDGVYNNFGGSGARFLNNFRFYKAQKLAAQMGSILNLEGSVVSAAQQLYKLVQSKNWIQGRSTSLVILACLYYVCRQNETGHLMIDFADVLNVDVYSLSKMYLKLTRDMNIGVKHIDPSIYVPRFMRALNFPKADEKKILDYVLRLLARMREDWLGKGRRPTGLIAAGFWIACKCFNVQKNMKEIASVLKVSEETIRKRVNEFKELKVAKLTKEEFARVEELGIKFDPEDPPAFKRLRMQSLKDEESKNDNKLLPLNNGPNQIPLNFLTNNPANESFASNSEGFFNFDKSEKDVNQSLAGISNFGLNTLPNNIAGNKLNSLDKQGDLGLIPCLNDVSAIALPNQMVPGDSNALVPFKVDDAIIRPEEFDDSEISACILQPHESKFKRLAWYKLYGDWIKEQKLKKERKEDMLQKTGRTKKIKKDSKDSIDVTSVQTNNEIVRRILTTKLANKVSTEALEKLFADAKNFKSNN